MYRWEPCPGSVALCATIPDRPSSVYARRGTMAHYAAAEWLETGLPPVFDNDEDFLAVAEYVRICGAYYSPEQQRLGAVRGVEYQFQTDIDGMYGTSDYWVYWPHMQHLTVLDYKHGEGILVSAVENKQLLYYALGVVMTQPWGKDVKTIELGIVQPRCMSNTDEKGFRTWTIDRVKLFEFEVVLRKAIEATRKPNAPLKVGEHCQFCPAHAICSAMEHQRNIALTSDFKGVVESQATVYDVRALAAALDMRDTLKAYLTALDEFAYREMNAGVQVPGYKLVAKRGQRKYKDPVLLENTLKSAGLGSAIYTKPELLSPAQLEKAIPSHKGLIAEHTVTESSGLTVVPESDKRPAASPEIEFTKVSLEALGL